MLYQHNDASKIEQNLNNFLDIYDWFVDNKLSIHFGEDKTESILFGTKQKLNKTASLNIGYQGFIQAILSTAISPQRFSFFIVCLVNYLREVLPWLVSRLLEIAFPRLFLTAEA